MKLGNLVQLSVAALLGGLVSTLAAGWCAPQSGGTATIPCITAREIKIVDKSGRLVAHLHVNEAGLPVLHMRGLERNLATFGFMGHSKDEYPHLMLSSPSLSLMLSASDVAGTGMTMKSEKTDAHAALIISPDQQSLMCLKSAKPSLLVEDSGFQTVIGSTSTTNTRTGETRERSAASVTMYDGSGKIIWNAP